MKQLNTRQVQIHGPGTLGSCIEAQLLGFIKVITVRCMHKEVHRTACQGMHQQQGVLYQAYAARLKAKPELCQYRIVAPVCKGNLCNCSGHKQLCTTGTRWWGPSWWQGAFNKEHQAKLLFETASLHSLEDKLDRMCAL